MIYTERAAFKLTDVFKSINHKKNARWVNFLGFGKGFLLARDFVS